MVQQGRRIWEMWVKWSSRVGRLGGVGRVVQRGKRLGDVREAV
jgi:hypothetical protein